MGGKVRELESVRDNVLRLLSNDEWVQWVHEGLLPANTSKEKAKNIDLARLSNHCAICRNVNGCCFPKNNNIKYPLHPNCHCYLVDIQKPQITADCRTEKFEGYIFSPEYEDNGKVQLYTKWGYDIMDTPYLIEELTRQAKESYSNGDFRFKKLDGYGQHITVIVQLESKNDKSRVKFKTGWLVYPNGNIKNTTPFSGEIK